MWDDHQQVKHSYSIWRKVVVNSVLLSIAGMLIQVALHELFNIKLKWNINSIIILVIIPICSLYYGRSERKKLPIILWLEGVALALNLAAILHINPWVLFGIQIVMAIVLYLLYKRYKDELF